MEDSTRTARARLRAVSRGARVVLALLVVIVLLPGAARADTGDLGYQDQSWSGTGTPTGTKRAESVLWFNDGSWWADMWDTVSQDFHIFRLDTGMQRWVDTGTAIDTRSYTHSDVLWDGTHLYVASHKYVSDGDPAVSGYPSYLYRFSYNPLTRTYSRDSGFPETINNEKSETLVIDKDSTGTVWATWQQDNQIYVNRTTNGDRGWGTPFKLPVNGTDVTVDDNAAVIAFGGNHIGVMWSNQTSANDGIYFAIHDDGQPAGTWSASRTAIQGSNSADDHMNLKSVQSAGGTVYAAVKTSFTTSTAPLIMLLVRDAVTGDWTSFPVARVSDCPNRPIVVIDTENRVLHSFATYPAPPSYTCSTSGGAIYEKVSPMDAIAFPTGRGTPVMVDADSPYINDVSSSKQNVNSTTGIALLASNNHTLNYWHSFEPISPAAPPSPPTAGFTATPTSGTAALSVAFTDTSSGNPTSWAWDFGDGTTSTAQSPTHVYQTAGSYTVTLTVTNSLGSDTATKADYITVQPPPPPRASFTASATSGAAPLAVAFTDTSSGIPTSWSWNFGDGTSSTVQNPTHTYASAGTYSVTLTVSNASGSDTITKADYISVTPPPPDFRLSVTPATATVVRGGSTRYTVTVSPSNGFAGDVNLSVSGLPSGVTASVSPNPLPVSGTATSTLTVSTSSTAKVGSATLKITASGSGVTHTASATLQVKRK